MIYPHKLFEARSLDLCVVIARVRQRVIFKRTVVGYIGELAQQDNEGKGRKMFFFFSDEGLSLETSALESLYSGQIT